MLVLWHLGVVNSIRLCMVLAGTLVVFLKKSYSSVNSTCHKVMFGVVLDSEQILKKVGPFSAPRSVG